jgi:hypothetical protein
MRLAGSNSHRPVLGDVIEVKWIKPCTGAHIFPDEFYSLASGVYGKKLIISPRQGASFQS